MSRIVFSRHCHLALRSRSKVGVKVKGQGQDRWSRLRVKGIFLVRSILAGRLCRVQQRVIAVHYQSNVLPVCDQGAYADKSADADDRLLI